MAGNVLDTIPEVNARSGIFQWKANRRTGDRAIVDRPNFLFRVSSIIGSDGDGRERRAWVEI